MKKEEHLERMGVYSLWASFNEKIAVRTVRGILVDNRFEEAKEDYYEKVDQSKGIIHCSLLKTNLYFGFVILNPDQVVDLLFLFLEQLNNNHDVRIRDDETGTDYPFQKEKMLRKLSEKRKAFLGEHAVELIPLRQGKEFFDYLEKKGIADDVALKFKKVKIVASDGKKKEAIIKIKEYDFLSIEIGGKTYLVEYKNNAYQTIRHLDLAVNKDGYKILCNGTSKNVVCMGFCANMAEGYKVYYDNPETKEMEVKDTFDCEDWNEYATFEEQLRTLFKDEQTYLDFKKRHAGGESG